ncbi:LON peptidase N-terminal domain and RING finger protein 1 [Madurella mycetomatis]|uniref:LON peptidase N-terminal domain and RING finger protein 1 n=1 Tax=Madurella mycetomatis TaxID=100816 RepID=A0A175W862_9PEZI|nr:LON peptidase N-terminal domain and RING finger protein 1 [Madurella mycetomatis]
MASAQEDEVLAGRSSATKVTESDRNAGIDDTPDSAEDVRPSPEELRRICPFPDCEKDHAVADCNLDVALGDVLDAVRKELETARSSPLASDLTTHVIVKDQWVAAGIPSLKDSETTSRLLQGGAFLATYTLAQQGDLKHDAEVSFASPLTEKHTAFDAELLAGVKGAARASVDCPLCYALFDNPVTTPCGHTLCRLCIRRVLDYARECPFCRRTLTIQAAIYPESYPSNQLLSELISTFWPDTVRLRKRAAAERALNDGSQRCDRAIFVCTLSLPTIPTFLHVFEPRYRLMIRRALEGDRTFGMVMHHPTGFMQLGTLLRIVKHEFLPDGRSLIQTVGTSRFRILEHDTLDGYMVARIQIINDISVAEEEEREAAELLDNDGGLRVRFPTTIEEIEQTPTRDLLGFAIDFVQRMQSQGASWLSIRDRAVYGACPHDPAHFPWWFAAVFPIKDAEKYKLLGTTSVRERLQMCCRWIMAWESATW